MEALAGLSLACNVLQLVGTGLKISNALKTIRDEHKPDPAVQSYAETLRQLADEVTNSLRTQSGSPTNTALCDRTKDVVTVAGELHTLLSDFTGGQRNKLYDWVLYLRKQGNIEALEQRLLKAQDALQSTILLDIWRNAYRQWDAIQVELPSLKSELQTLVTELQRGNTSILDIIAKQDVTLQALDVIRNDTLHIRDKETQNRQDSELKGFMASLYFPSMNARRNMPSIVASGGTFNWVLEMPSPQTETTTDHTFDNRTRTAGKLRLWLQDPSQRIFWVSGKPGSGKSTLMHYLAGKLSATTSAGNDASPVMMSAFIWASGDGLQRSVKGLLCTLVHQIFSQRSDLAKAALDFNMAKVTISDWSEAELRSTLASAVQSAQGLVYVVIDGLDEIHLDDGGPDRLMDVVRLLSAHANIKLCVSSRPEVFFERALQHYPHFRLQDLTRADMEHYARQELAEALGSIPKPREDRHSPTAILRYLADQAKGVFLWLQLVIRSLKSGITNGDTWEVLWERISELPVDLQSMYEKMAAQLKRETKSYRKFAATVFALLLMDDQLWPPVESMCMERPFQGLDMDKPISIALYFDKDVRCRVVGEGDWDSDDGITELLQRCVERVCELVHVQCAGLVEVPSKALNSGIRSVQKFDFVHRTVRDFMLEAGRGLWQEAMPPDLGVCLDVQRAQMKLWGHDDIKPTGGLWEPPLVDGAMDVRLLEWCSRVAPEGLPGNHREAAFEHLERAMTAEGIWSRDGRNPCLLAVTSPFDIVPPRRWLGTWTPTGLSSAADFADHLLVAHLAMGIVYSASVVPVLWLCDNGGRLSRRRLSHWPGNNWPSAFALLVECFRRQPSVLGRALYDAMQLGVDLEEHVTLLCRPEGGCVIAFSPFTSSFPTGNDYDTIHLVDNIGRLPLLRLRIPALIFLALQNIQPDQEDAMRVAQWFLQHHGTTEASIQLLGFVKAVPSNTSGWSQLGVITSGYKLERKLSLVLPSSSPTLAAAQYAIQQFHAEIQYTLQTLVHDRSQLPMDSQETVDWMLAWGFAEDKRDQYYAQMLEGAEKRRAH
ncbi:ankyrin repeat domain-containing protein 50 [Microdochium nivale]|nr:ankyrin repeat domain-containing protein 50 [Microdochium nivale]